MSTQYHSACLCYDTFKNGIVIYNTKINVALHQIQNATQLKMVLKKRYLQFISDLHKKHKFFADDPMLFSVIKDPQLSASDLNHDLEVINQWAYQWKMAFNPDPIKQATDSIFV